MGMESHQGPRRRRVGTQNPSDRIQMSVRLTREAGLFIEAMQEPGSLHEEGCSKGDVIEVAIRSLAAVKGVTSKGDLSQGRQ